MNKINSITSLVSSSCNLNCSFCYLHKHDTLIKYDQEILKSWKNKTYLFTIKKVLEKLKENPQNIISWSFWGGETLIHIKEITPNIENMLKFFPNIQRISLSTNWTINIQDFFDFLLEVDKYANQEIVIGLQLSIDGPPGILSNQGHNGWDKYISNLELFSNLVNNHKFNYVNIEIQINATTSKELYLKEFSSCEKIKKYCQYMFDFVNKIKKMCISKSLNMYTNMVFPGCANPSDATTEEGIELGKISRLWASVYMSEFAKLYDIYELNLEFGSGINGLIGEENYFSSNNECSELQIGLTICPDGTIVECPSSYIEHFENYQNECLEQNDLKRYYSSRIHAAVAFNPLGATEQEIKRYRWSVLEGVRDNSSTYLYFSKRICEVLAKTGQIDPIYQYDTQSLVNYLLDLSHVSYCTHENINLTLSPFLTSVSFFRRYLNGYIEYLHNHKLNQIKREKRI